jgi:hypothetical protein
MSATLMFSTPAHAAAFIGVLLEERDQLLTVADVLVARSAVEGRGVARDRGHVTAGRSGRRLRWCPRRVPDHDAAAEGVLACGAGRFQEDLTTTAGGRRLDQLGGAHRRYQHQHGATAAMMVRVRGRRDGGVGFAGLMGARTMVVESVSEGCDAAACPSPCSTGPAGVAGTSEPSAVLAAATAAVVDDDRTTCRRRKIFFGSFVSGPTGALS